MEWSGSLGGKLLEICHAYEILTKQPQRGHQAYIRDETTSNRCLPAKGAQVQFDRQTCIASRTGDQVSQKVESGSTPFPSYTRALIIHRYYTPAQWRPRRGQAASISQRPRLDVE